MKKITKSLMVLGNFALISCGTEAIEYHTPREVVRHEITCAKVVREEGTSVTCTNGLEFFIPAEKEYDIPTIDIVTLCPELGQPNEFKEVLFNINDELFALYDSPKGEFLTKLFPGKYVTTDGRGCYFEITQDYEILY